MPTRRSFVLGTAATTLAPFFTSARSRSQTRAPSAAASGRRLYRVRAITAGVAMESFRDASRIEVAVKALLGIKRRFEERGYEVQTIRVVTPSLLATASGEARKAALSDIRRLDSLVAERGAVLSIGSILAVDQAAPDIGSMGI